MLDSIDIKILQTLQLNGRLKNVDLSEIVNLSPTPCLNRVRRLEESGVITGYRTTVDPAKVGLSVCSLVLIKLSNNRRHAVDEFSNAVQQVAAVTECFLATGRYDYVAKVYARDFNHYEAIIKDDLAELPHIDSFETLFLFGNLAPDSGIDFGNAK